MCLFIYLFDVIEDKLTTFYQNKTYGKYHWTMIRLCFEIKINDDNEMLVQNATTLYDDI